MVGEHYWNMSTSRERTQGLNSPYSIRFHGLYQVKGVARGKKGGEGNTLVKTNRVKTVCKGLSKGVIVKVDCTFS